MIFLYELLETAIKLKGRFWYPVIGKTYWNLSKNKSIGWQLGLYQSMEPFYYAEIDPDLFFDYPIYNPDDFIVYGKNFRELYNNWIDLINDKGEKE